tara:strand:- start:110 stop:307 length:198 start_codon:yes stop_codon:yes gene_type:complete
MKRNPLIMGCSLILKIHHTLFGICQVVTYIITKPQLPAIITAPATQNPVPIQRASMVETNGDLVN